MKPPTAWRVIRTRDLRGFRATLPKGSIEAGERCIELYLPLAGTMESEAARSEGPTRRVMAWIAVVDMVATVVTGLMVYYYGFMN